MSETPSFIGFHRWLKEKGYDWFNLQGKDKSALYKQYLAEQSKS